MKASNISITANLIDELETIGFEVIPMNSLITLSDEGKVLDVTPIFQNEVERLHEVGVYDFEGELFDSALSIEAYFINSFDYNPLVTK